MFIVVLFVIARKQIKIQITMNRRSDKHNIVYNKVKQYSVIKKNTHTTTTWNNTDDSLRRYTESKEANW